MDKAEKSEEGGSPRNAPGILRVDTSRSRIVVQPPGEPSSPQPSVDRLSVSFAPEYDKSSWSDAEISPQPSPVVDLPSDASVRVNVFNMQTDGGGGGSGGGGPSPFPVGAPPGQGGQASSGNRLSVLLSDEDDDYSASMTAILQRRASHRKVKGGKRRTSSPFDSDRRRSSVFTTSSGDTAITMEGEGGTNKEQIFENIRLHKELLEHVKQQPWDMRRKLKLTQQAKQYVRVHEGELQERLAQSKSTKDIMARLKLFLMRYWQQVKRDLTNLGANLVPWESRIKEIESHFGSVVASYFTFLRWVFWINLVISAIFICFAILPEYFAADRDPRNDPYKRKELLEHEKKNATYLQTLWEFEGMLKHSPMFYGYYTDAKISSGIYPLPLSYFLTGLGVYVYSFVTILRKMAENSRNSKLSDKDDECAFSWRLFTAWDFMIGNPETAFNRFASITMGFKEALLEEKERTKDERNWKVIALRVIANILVILLLISSASVVYFVVQLSANVKSSSWFVQNQQTLVLTAISFVFPYIFELIGMMENNHPRKQLRWQLARIMVLNLLNLYTLIFALFGTVHTKSVQLKQLRPNATTTTMTPLTEAATCFEVNVNCTLLNEYEFYENIKETTVLVNSMSKLSTLLPVGDIVTSLFPNSSYILNSNGSSGLYNVTDLLNIVLHALSHLHNSSQPGVFQVAGYGNFTNSTESWSEIQDNETYTLKTNDSSLDLRDPFLWTPENTTTLVSMLPILTAIIINKLSTVYPLPSKTTPYIGEGGITGASNVTFPPIFSSTYHTGATSSSEYFESTEQTTQLTKGVKGRKGKGKKKQKGNKPKRNVYDEIGRLLSTEPPGSDYTEPDDSRYPTVSNEYDEYNNLIIGSTGNGYVGKSSTRGDIPIVLKDDPTTTTTEMPSTTVLVTEPTTPDSAEKLWTDVMAMVTMIVTHNSKKTTEQDYEKLHQFTKLVTIVESAIETRRTTAGDYNSTFETTVKVSSDGKEMRKCYVTVCENGNTSPEGISKFLNCSSGDYNCTMTALLGPRSDGCWVPKSSFCVVTTTMSPDTQKKLRELCWETMFGQEIVKLTVMDLIFTLVLILVLEFMRAVLVRVLNPCCFVDLEKKRQFWDGYGEFNIAENVLHLVNNQGMVWMGMFFSPGLPTLNVIKLVILMYIRSWSVMTCNVPHETVFRASRSNNFYFALLLFMLFLCTLPVAYAIVWLEPSWHCGPFSEYAKIYHILTTAILNSLPTFMHPILDYIASPGIVIPLLLLLVLIIYYLLSLTGALREANNDLKNQLRRERTEERRKMFKMAGGKGKNPDTPLGKWQMLIPMVKDPSKPQSEAREKRASILTTGKMTGFAGAAKRAALKARQIQAAAAAAAAAEDDGNATDIDQASLPEDAGIGPAGRKGSRPVSSGGTRKPSCTDSVASTRSEIPVIKISEEQDDSPKPGPSSGAGGGSSTPAKPIVVHSKKQRVLKALIKAGKEQQQDPEMKEDDSSKDEDDDYSASMTGILQRRASHRKVKGGKRRTSSPFDSDRRRSSVFTTSSGDTAITMEGEGGTNKEQIFENIRLHKELLEHVKQQPWDMRRKLKLIQQAKQYVRVHEGKTLRGPFI